MANYELEKTVRSEIVQMDKIAKVIDPMIKVGTIFDKFPPKPAGHNRTEYLELKLQFFEEKEKAFRNVVDEIKRMTSK